MNRWVWVCLNVASEGAADEREMRGAAREDEREGGAAREDKREGGDEREDEGEVEVVVDEDGPEL